MANPQLENGYIMIATTIYEALVKIRIPGEARQVLDLIIRKTYGFHKGEDIISVSQFAVATGLKRPSVIRAIKRLLEMNLISKKANNSYSLQKNFDIWKPLAKKLTVSQKANGVSVKAKKSLAKKLPTKDISTKDTSTKDTVHCRSHPNEAKTPLMKVLKAYRLKRFPEIEELPEPQKTEEIRKWNKQNISRLSKYAKELLEYLGNWQTVVICIDEIGTEFDDNPNIADWSLAAISKNASRWKLKQKR